MKSISVSAALIALLLEPAAAVTQGQAENYYVYETPHGGLVITNKEPPPGSKITKRFSFPDAPDNEVQQSQQPNNPQPNGQTEGTSKTSSSGQK